MSVKAICAITNAPPARACTVPVPTPAPPSLRATVEMPRTDCSAGTTPNSSPVSNAAPTVVASTCKLMPTLCRRGSDVLASDTSNGTPHAASSTPTAAPASASSIASVSTCRIMRIRVAPSAARIAVSRSRATARARSRFATLAQAMSSTRPTAASARSSGLRTSPTAISRIVVGTVTLGRRSPMLLDQARSTASRSALARASVTPGRSRPTSSAFPAGSNAAGIAPMERHRSVPSERNSGGSTGNRKVAGITPTICTAVPSRVMERPSTWGSRPKRATQKR